eukprot:m.128363 g.128363  ORF g.128363 m.128363 type:complete len:215 (-) comp29329_c0_seq1:59-703(-)
MANFALLKTVMGELKKKSANNTSNSIERLWDVRAETAKKLFGDVLHPGDIGTFAVQAMTVEQLAVESEPTFEVSTQIHEGHGVRVVLKGASPSACHAALRWYLKAKCRINFETAKSTPLPIPLPQVPGGYKAYRVIKPDGQPTWKSAVKHKLDADSSTESQFDAQEGLVQNRIQAVFERIRCALNELAQEDLIAKGEHKSLISTISDHQGLAKT